MIRTLLVFLFVLCSQMLYAQEATGWDTHEISKKLGGAGLLILIILVVVYYSKQKKK